METTCRYDQFESMCLVLKCMFLCRQYVDLIDLTDEVDCISDSGDDLPVISMADDTRLVTLQ